LNRLNELSNQRSAVSTHLKRDATDATRCWQMTSNVVARDVANWQTMPLTGSSARNLRRSSRCILDCSRRAIWALFSEQPCSARLLSAAMALALIYISRLWIHGRGSSPGCLRMRVKKRVNLIADRRAWNVRRNDNYYWFRSNISSHRELRKTALIRRISATIQRCATLILSHPWKHREPSDVQLFTTICIHFSATLGNEVGPSVQGQWAPTIKYIKKCFHRTRSATRLLLLIICWIWVRGYTVFEGFIFGGIR
jgi:hypothetical protein